MPSQPANRIFGCWPGAAVSSIQWSAVPFFWRSRRRCATGAPCIRRQTPPRYRPGPRRRCPFGWWRTLSRPKFPRRGRRRKRSRTRWCRPARAPTETPRRGLPAPGGEGGPRRIGGLRGNPIRAYFDKKEGTRPAQAPPSNEGSTSSQFLDIENIVPTSGRHLDTDPQ